MKKLKTPLMRGSTKCAVFLFLCLYLIVNGISAQADKGDTVTFGSKLINKDWRFHLGDISAQVKKSYEETVNTAGQDNTLAASDPRFDDSRWRLLDLPHDWSVEGTLSPSLSSCTGYLPGGIGWYRRHLGPSSIHKGMKQYLYFEGVYNHSEVFVNGHSVGIRPNGYISFMYDITPFLTYEGDNVIAIKVDHSLSSDSRWYTGSGIYANVFLTESNPVHIDQWGVFYQLKTSTTKSADVNVQVAVNNTTTSKTDVTVKLSFISAEGKVEGSTSYKVEAKASGITASSGNINIKAPVLWDIQHPYLYQLKTQIYQVGKLIDENIQQAGLRTLTFDANKGFALNGQWTKMKGVCIHNDAGVLGSSVPREVWKQRLNTLKSIGCNAIRMSHNPHVPDLYDVCDELGFVVMDEAFDEWEYPKKKWIEGWNRGIPGFEGNASFFKEWSDRDMADLVLRDRNHPSIVMWSIGNEVDYPNDPYSHPILKTGKIGQPVQGGYLPDNPPAERLGVIAQDLAAVVRKLDTSRPVTAALAGIIMSNETDYPSAIDVVGYNYTENRYEEDHKGYPKRVIYGSENGQDMDAWKAVRDKDYIFAQFLWTGIDYLGEANAWPSRGFNSGMIDMAGYKKPRAFFREALWSDKPVTYIGTYPAPEESRRLSIDAWPVWNYNAGEKIRVVCYTNCKESKLFLNDKQVGATLPYDGDKGIIYWDVPFENGKLEVIGYNEGKEACRYAVQTSEQPHRIDAKADMAMLKPGQDLAQIDIRILDEHGYPVFLSDNEITCTIDGPAKLLGLESGSNDDMGNYRDNKQRVLHGRLMAYIKATGTPGKINVTFTSPWLEKTKLNLEFAK